MKKYTPSPWAYLAAASYEDGDQEACIVSADKGACLGGDNVVWAADHGFTHEADAVLAAAAPELLSALRGILEIGKRDMSNPKYDGYFEDARALVESLERAIAESKAVGE